MNKIEGGSRWDDSAPEPVRKKRPPSRIAKATEGAFKTEEVAGSKKRVVVKRDKVVQPARKKTAPDIAEEVRAFAYSKKAPSDREIAAFIKSHKGEALQGCYEGLAMLPGFEQAPMSPLERLQLAYHIVHVVPAIAEIANVQLVTSSSEPPPRDIYVTEKRRIVIMAKPDRSVLSAKGSWKEVFSGVKLSQDKVKPVAIARMPIECSEQELTVNAEMHFYLKLKELQVPGVAKARFYLDITGLKGRSQKAYVHKFSPEVRYEFHKVAAFDRYDGSLENKKGLSLEQKCVVARSVLETVKCMHDHKIIHGDLKLENILYKMAADGQLIPAVTDFGLSFYNRGKSSKLPDDSFGNGTYGTPVASCPELINQAHFKGDLEKTDAWALGIVLYELLFEKPVPWKSEIPDPYRFLELGEDEQKKILENLKAAIFTHTKPFQAKIARLEKLRNPTPEQQLELLAYKLLQPDPEKRLSVKEAFQHV